MLISNAGKETILDYNHFYDRTWIDYRQVLNSYKELYFNKTNFFVLE